MMQKYILDFVNHYKAVLALPIKRVYFSRKDYVELIIAVFIMVGSFVVIGMIVKSLNNIYYTFFMLNTSFIFTFLLSRYKTYLKYATQVNEKYNLYIILTVETMHLLSLIMTFQLIFFYLFFQSIIAVSFYISIAVVSMITTILTIYVQKQMGITQFNLVNVILWLLISFACLFYLLPIESLQSKYLISTIIVLLMFLYKLFIQKSNDEQIDDDFTTIVLLIIICFLALFNLLNFVYTLGFLSSEPIYLNQERFRTHQNLLLSKPLVLMILTFFTHLEIKFSLMIRGTDHA
jgi:hypothetical protein